jgi:hypothetical protein
VTAGVAGALVAVAALFAGYAIVRAAIDLAAGHEADAARWATMTFAAGVPLIAAYGVRAVGPRTGVRLPLALLAVVAASIVFQALLASGSYFTGDDWLHLVLAHDAASHAGPPSLDYLGRPVFIHYAPGLRFGYWVLARTAELSWGAALAAMLVLFAGSIALLHRILRRLFGERRSNLVLVLLFGTSILLVTSFLWFSDGLHKLPSTFLSLLAVDAYLTYHLTRRKSALLLAVAAVSLGSLFYVKALLVPLYLVLIRVLFLEERPRRALRVLWEERFAWLAFVPTFAIYGWNYEQSYAHIRAARPSLDLLGNYLWIAWYKGVTPAFLGVEVGPNAARSGALFATFAQILLILVVALSVRLKRSAWRAWAFWGIAFLANATLIGLGRLGQYSLERVGSELRYDTEMAWLLPLALGFAFFPGRVAAQPAPARPQPRRPLLLRAAAAAAVLGYAVAAIATGSAISSSWRERNSGPAEAYVEHLRADVARLDAPEAIDDQVPAFLIGSSAKPWNRLERLVPAVEPRLRIVAAAAHPFQVGDDGHVGRAWLQPLSTGPHALATTGAVTLVSGRARRLCIAGGGELRYSSKRLLAGQSLYARIAYDVRRPSSRPGSIAERPLPLDAPRGSQLVNLGRPLRLALPPGTRACVRSIAVGWLGSNGR